MIKICLILLLMCKRPKDKRLKGTIISYDNAKHIMRILR